MAKGVHSYDQLHTSCWFEFSRKFFFRFYHNFRNKISESLLTNYHFISVNRPLGALAPTAIIQHAQVQAEYRRKRELGILHWFLRPGELIN
jgi:hypothetical protein